MKIKDFNDHVRVCSKVLYHGRVCIVQDIDRREHAMALRCLNNGTLQRNSRGNIAWIRCSEVDMIGQEAEGGAIRIVEV